MSRLSNAGRLLAVAAIVVTVGACEGLGSGSLRTIGSAPYDEGSGRVASETRQVESFHGISASQGVTVFLSNASAISAKVTADDNLLSHITTEVRDGTLVIGVSGSIRTRNELKVTVTAPAIDDIGASAGATVDSEDLQGGSVSVSANSGATVRGGGKVDSLDLAVDAGATADLRNVETSTATVRVNTGSTAYVNAKEEVGGSCGTGSTLHVRGGARTDAVSKDMTCTVQRD